MVIVDANHKSELLLGYQGESERTCVQFNLEAIAEEYPGGVVTLLVKRPGDTNPYPVLLVQDGDIYSWYVGVADTSYDGDGECQLTYQVGTVIVKTHKWPTHILESMTGATVDPPDPWESFVEDVLAAADEVMEAVRTVPQAIDAALEEAKESGEFDGVGIASIRMNEDYTLTITLTDGNHYDTDPVRGPKGDKGDTGNGIATIAMNPDYTLTITYTNGQSVTTDPIRGEKGDKGDKGDTGNGIASITLNADYTLTINYTDGTHITTDPIRGEKGDKGDKGDTGATPDISIGTVETLAPGSQATATMTGTPEHPVLNLGIPEGQKGDKGEQGEVTLAELMTRAPVIIGNASGGVVNFIDGADNMPFKSIIADFLPIQAGSGDASPVNPRPLSGLTGLTIRRGGKNLLKNVGQSGSASGITWTMNADGSVSLSGTAEADISTLNFNPNILAQRQIVGYGTVSLVCNGRASYNPSIEGINFQSDIYVDGAYTRTLQSGTSDASTRYTFNGGTIAIGTSRLRIASGTVIPDGTVFYPMIEIGTNPSDYEPCKTDEYIITWQSETGTVYGARLNPLTGKMYITWLLNTYDGSENWKLAASIASWFYIEDFVQNLAWTSLGIDFALSDEYKQQWAPAVANMESGRFGITNVGGKYRLVFKDTAYATLAEWKAHLAQNNLQLAYKLAQPIEVNLTPVEITTLLGCNSLWTGVCNMSAEYPIDTKLYIDNAIANIQALVLENISDS